jgi:hypothetical protein
MDVSDVLIDYLADIKHLTEFRGFGGKSPPLSTTTDISDSIPLHKRSPCRDLLCLHRGDYSAIWTCIGSINCASFCAVFASVRGV